MMDSARLFHRGINPGFEYLKNKKIVFGHHTRVHDFAFEIGVALGDKRCFDISGCCRREVKGLELINTSA
jgi:hypothetical protein